MKRYTAATARQQFSHLLDAVERGESVLIERRGVRFRLHTERQATPKRTPRTPVIEIVDPAVVAGEWKWEWEPEGVRFAATKRGRR
jgi:antitoxin (DNA-binding transcriptional repressor) of toxin-antitoxin stability system